MVRVVTASVCICLFVCGAKDAELLDVEDFQYSGVNITAFRLVDRQHPDVSKLARRWSKRLTSSTRHVSPLVNERGFRVMRCAPLCFADIKRWLYGGSVIGCWSDHYLVTRMNGVPYALFDIVHASFSLLLVASWTRYYYAANAFAGNPCLHVRVLISVFLYCCLQYLVSSSLTSFPPASSILMT